VISHPLRKTKFLFSPDNTSAGQKRVRKKFGSIVVNGATWFRVLGPSVNLMVADFYNVATDVKKKKNYIQLKKKTNWHQEKKRPDVWTNQMQGRKTRRCEEEDK
jgi:hypothetical protein